MRNSIESFADYKHELARLRQLEDQQELQLKQSLQNLQDSMQPANVIKEAFATITDKFSGIGTVAGGLRLGLELLSDSKTSKKEVNPIVRWLTSIFVSNAVKATEGEKRFDWPIFFKGIAHDLTDAAEEKDDEND